MRSLASTTFVNQMFICQIALSDLLFLSYRNKVNSFATKDLPTTFLSIFERMISSQVNIRKVSVGLSQTTMKPALIMVLVRSNSSNMSTITSMGKQSNSFGTMSNRIRFDTRLRPKKRLLSTTTSPVRPK